MAPNSEDRQECLSSIPEGYAPGKRDRQMTSATCSGWMSRSWKIGCVLKVDDAPSYAREKAITTGYRHPLSYAGCIRSMFWMHNETINIWTHLLGFVYFVYLMERNFTTEQPHNRSTSDLIAVTVQLITYQVCMLFSSLFHTFLCHSEAVKITWQEADHAGILLALWGTYARLIVTKFSCFPISLSFHLVCITAIFTLVFFNKFKSFFLPKSGFNDKDSCKRENGVQLYLFLALSLYAVAPFAHWISISPALAQNNANSQMIQWMFFPYFVGGLGLFFYLSRVPECLLPCGRVDICGASHQIWHMLIFAGMVSWYELTCWMSATRPLTCQINLDHLTSNSTLASLAFMYK